MEIPHIDLAGQPDETIRLSAPWKRLRNLYRRRIEGARIDKVVREWLPRFGIPERDGARQAEQSTEVPTQHVFGGDKRDAGISADPFRRSLVIAKDKQSVVADGSPKRPAELVPLEPVLLASEEIPGVQLLVAEKLKSVAVPGVAA